LLKKMQKTTEWIHARAGQALARPAELSSRDSIAADLVLAHGT
jgi:hypothetical protein